MSDGVAEAAAGSRRTLSSCSAPSSTADLTDLSSALAAAATFYPSKKCLITYGTGMVSLDVTRWPLFSLLEEDFVSSLRLVYVYGAGTEALLVTRDDQVYALGTNASACLGLGDVQSCLEPRKVDQLCSKSIVSVSSGSGPHVLALTSSGDVFSWGHNGYCQLGNGSSSQGSVPSLVSVNLVGRKVVEVACGSHHSLARTSDGEVFAWGQNNCGQVGCGTTANQPSPRKVSACIGGRHCVRIVCGQSSSMALLDSGEVYGWGYNGNGQLGVGNNVNQPNPCRVAGLQGIYVAQLVCGSAHALALSDEGAVYAWGANSYGQLGTGNKSNAVSPIRVATDLGRFIELAACAHSHTSAGVLQTGRVLMWGQCRGQSVSGPLATNFDSTHDVFASFSMPPISWTPLITEAYESRSVTDCLKRSFDDPGTGDIRFQVEGRTIHAHKAILRIRCEHFRNMFRSDWKEMEHDVVEINHYSYPVYRAFLEYLYTDKIDLSPDDAIGLLDLANSYCEGSLKRLCERCIRLGVAVDNVAMIYAAAIKFAAVNLEQFCFRFTLNHLTAVTQTEAFMQLDDLTIKNLIKLASQHGAFKY